MASKPTVILASLIFSFFLVGFLFLSQKNQITIKNTSGGYNILVTGGAGFIGSHIVQHFELNEPKCDKIYVLDDLTTGKKKNIAKFRKVELVIGSIGDKSILESYISKDIKYLFHFAAKTSVGESHHQPLEYIQINSLYTLGLIELAEKYKLESLVYASSAVVYGPHVPIPMKEDQKLYPTSPYGKSKEISEWMITNSKIKGISLRFFNVYGEKQPQSSSIVSNFISAALEGNNLIIHGDGLQSRDFIYVRDIVEASILAAKTLPKGIYNVGTSVNTTVVDLATKIIQLTKSTSKIEHVDGNVEDRQDSVASIDKLKSFGWTPQFNFDQGLEKQIAWMKWKKKKM